MEIAIFVIVIIAFALFAKKKKSKKSSVKSEVEHEIDNGEDAVFTPPKIINSSGYDVLTVTQDFQDQGGGQFFAGYYSGNAPNDWTGITVAGSVSPTTYQGIAVEMAMVGNYTTDSNDFFTFMLAGDVPAGFFTGATIQGLAELLEGDASRIYDAVDDITYWTWLAIAPFPNPPWDGTGDVTVIIRK